MILVRSRSSVALGEVPRPVSRRLVVLGALVTALVATAIAATPRASAQDAAREEGSVVGSDYAVDPLFEPTPEQFTAELRMGAYRPDLGDAFQASFGGDLGPLLGAELDVHVWRIPYVGPIAVGASFGWAEWNGAATVVMGSAGTNVGETGLSLVNFNLLLVLRADVLARSLDFPLILTGKVGPDFGYWQTGTAGRTDADGWSVGLRWAAQVALELDFLEPRAARRLDDEWGINHSEIFFELYGSTMGQWSSDMLPMGTGLAWVAGLGFTF